MFTGRKYDTETGLYYYRARYYRPSIGRFLQTDPIGYKGGMNLYSYCGNNPLNYIDPSGKRWYDWTPVVGTIVNIWKRYNRSVPGMDVEDYKSYTPLPHEVVNDPYFIEQEIQKYRQSVNRQMLSYIGEETIPGIARGAIEAIVGLIVGTKSPIAGGIVAIDGAVNVICEMSTRTEIKEAATKAISSYEEAATEASDKSS